MVRTTRTAGLKEVDLLSGRQVLVVEDEGIISMLIEDMVIDLGCAVVGPATRLDQALALAGEARIDIAILDVNLDGEPTYPVADALAARGVPFVFATGYASEGLPESYSSVLTLSKPFRQRDLEQALTQALQQA